MIGLRADTKDHRKPQLLLLGLAIILAGLHLLLVFRLNINWDELRYLSVIHEFERGSLDSALQTLHVHPFRWLLNIGPTEIDQVIAARLVYYAFLLGSCGWLFLIARRFLSAASALFVILCYLSYAEIIAHATSFRFDGLSAFLLLGGLALVTQERSPRVTAMGAGVLTGVAFLVTIKSIFYLPVLALVLMLRGARGQPKERIRDLCLFLLSLGSATVILYSLHRMSLPAPAVADSAELIRQAGPRFIRFDQLFPGRVYLFASVAGNAVIWLFLLIGLRIVVGGLGTREDRRAALRLLALLTPLGSLVFYRNAFPYFYVFVMPPALVLTGLWFEQHLRRYRENAGRPLPMLVLMVAAVVASFVIHYVPRLPDETATQRQVVEAVHRIFPDPVPYIDRNSMIASFPKVGFFMSTLGFQSYYDRGEPIFRELLQREEPRFLLANHPALILDPTVPAPEVPGQPRLFEQDFQVLQENFVPHWGPIYVAGKRLNLAADEPDHFEILIPAIYTLEAEAEVLIEDRAYTSGDTVHLTRREYSATSARGTQQALLRLGVGLHRPEAAPPTGVLYGDF